jgi:cystathionine beta-lyase/cystathionine gamma-synthase
MTWEEALERETRRELAEVQGRMKSGYTDDAAALERHRRFLRAALAFGAAAESARRCQAPTTGHSSPDAGFGSYGQAGREASPFGFAYSRWWSGPVAECEEFCLRHFGIQGLQACLLTNTGMSAVNLALEAVLLLETPQRLRILMVGPYGETREQCTALAASGRVAGCEEVPDVPALRKRLSEGGTDAPRALVCADAIENGPGMRSFDFPALLRADPRRQAHAPGYLLLDRTLVGHLRRATVRQALEERQWLVVEVESLTKYHQRGLDLTTLGAAYIPLELASRLGGGDAQAGLRALWRLRAGMGWSPAEAAVLTFPFAAPGALERRLRRHFSNAANLARACASARTSAWQVSHPSLYGHPGCRQTSTDGIVGGLLFLRAQDSSADAEELAEGLISGAAQAGLVLSRRASFGFNETSLDPWGREILRVSAGTEAAPAVRRIGRLFRRILGDWAGRR